MPSTAALIKVELFKMFRRATFWVGIGVFVLLIAFISFMSYRFSPSYDVGMPTDYLEREIEFFEQELKREGITEEEKLKIEEILTQYRLELELGTEAARKLMLQEQLKQLKEDLEDPLLPAFVRENLEQQIQVTELELAGDYQGVQRLYMTYELAGIEEELASGSLAPSKERELENQKKGLELRLAVMDANSTEGNNAYRAMLQILYAMSSFFLPLFIALLAAEQIAGEHAQGTLNLSLIRPVSRIRLFLTRYGALFTATTLIVAVVVLFSFTLGGAFTTFNGMNELIIVGTAYSEGLREVSYEHAALISLGEVALYSVGMLLVISAVVAAMALFFSGLFRSSFLPVICVLGLTIIGSILQSVQGIAAFYKYLPFPHFNALYHFGEYAPAVFEGMTPGFSLFILIIYGVIFTAAGAYLFQRKDILA